jgi:hypothetical protein
LHRNTLLSSQTGSEKNPVGGVVHEKLTQGEAVLSCSMKLEGVVVNLLNIETLTGWAFRELVPDGVALH